MQTYQDQRSYKATMPEIAAQVERLNANLEPLLGEFRKQHAPAPPALQHQPDADPK